MMRAILPAGLFCLIAGAASASTAPPQVESRPLRTVAQVDLARYVGTWCEIASYPQRFQTGCTATTAVYSLREDGMIQVVTRCYRDSLDGRETVARGRARVVDRNTNASGILERLTEQGYDVGRLQVTLQPTEPAGS